jgi:hypothetical protein
VSGVGDSALDDQLQLVFKPELEIDGTDPEFRWSFALAFVAPEHRADLLALKEGDRVLVQGTLSVGNTPETPTLSDSRLVSAADGVE